VKKYVCTGIEQTQGIVSYGVFLLWMSRI